MPRCRMLTAALVALAGLCGAPRASADPWRIEGGRNWQKLSPQDRDRYVRDMLATRDHVEQGRYRAARRAFWDIKKSYPEITGKELDLFVKGELAYCCGKYNRATNYYEKLLNEHAESDFYDAALDRQFTMAEAMLAGKKVPALIFFRVKAYSDGVEIMEKISDRTGLDDPNGVGLKAALAVAEHYEQRKLYSEAHLKWSEIASYYDSGPVGKKALLSMADNQLASYNKHPYHKRPRFDASRLTSAKSYYEKFVLLYPQDASDLQIGETLRHIDEQLALKQYTIAQYYRRLGKSQAANLYFDMVARNWPETEAGARARQMLQAAPTGESER